MFLAQLLYGQGALLLRVCHGLNVMGCINGWFDEESGLNHILRLYRSPADRRLVSRLCPLKVAS